MIRYFLIFLSILRSILPFILIGYGTYVVAPDYTFLVMGLVIWIDFLIPKKSD